MAASETVPLLNHVLVTGGSGFPGSYVVEALLQEPQCLRVVVIGRNRKKFRFPRAFCLAVDYAPMKFWDFTRAIWAAAGDTTRPEDVKVVPMWLILSLASIEEYLIGCSHSERRAPHCAGQIWKSLVRATGSPSRNTNQAWL